MYSPSASDEPSLRWITSNCVFGSRWKQMKKRPGPGIDLGVEAAEGLGHRLDPLVRQPCVGIEALCLLDIAALDGPHEGLGAIHEQRGLALDVGGIGRRTRRPRRSGRPSTVR